MGLSCLGGATFIAYRIQSDVLVETADLGKRVLTSGGLDKESDNFRSSLFLSAPRPRGVLSSSPLFTATAIPDNSDFAPPRVACESRCHDSGTVSISHSSSSGDGTGGFDRVRRNMQCGDVKYGDCARDGGTGMSTG